jgi:hypothetical protein
LIANRSWLLPGTRSMSPNEQKMTPGWAAIASALSMISSGVTQTGQPGPWIISIALGQQLVDAVPMIEWVWPPQTSIMAQGRVVTAEIWSTSLRARSGLLNSSRYFTAPLLPVGRPG